MSEQTNYINLDTILGEKKETAKDQVIVIQEAITPITPTRIVDWDSILNEVSYKLPKGYPTVIDGVFTEREEIIIINEALEAEGLSTLPLPEVGKPKRVVTNIAKPDVGNDIALKEGLVCLMYDAIGSVATLKQVISKAHQDNAKTKEPINPKIIETVFKALKQTFSQNSKRYGATQTAPGEDEPKSMPKNLDLYVQWAYKSNDEKAIKIVNNAFACANAIEANIGRGVIIRNNDFESIRSRAVNLAAEIGITKLKPDNWCPGDVYLLMENANVDDAVKSTKLFQLNKFFGKTNKIVACSLKEEKAQAGKATEFLQKVFGAEFVAPIDKKELIGNDTKGIIAKIAAKDRYMQYSPTHPKVLGKKDRK